MPRRELLKSLAALAAGGTSLHNLPRSSGSERILFRDIARDTGMTFRHDNAASPEKFLIETMVLSIGGGIIGVVLGVITPLAVGQLTSMKTVITAWSLIVAFGISAAVGIIFGLYPASRAADLHPIEALRHE